jgi:hypothetical protein
MGKDRSWWRQLLAREYGGQFGELSIVAAVHDGRQMLQDNQRLAVASSRTRLIDQARLSGTECAGLTCGEAINEQQRGWHQILSKIPAERLTTSLMAKFTRIVCRVVEW